MLDSPLHLNRCVMLCTHHLPYAGVKTAYTWYSTGARTLEDVLAGKGGIRLTPQQEIGIRYYDGKSALLR